MAAMTHPQFHSTGAPTLAIGGNFTTEQFFNLIVETFYLRADRTARVFPPIPLDLPLGAQVPEGLTNADWFAISLIKNIENVFGGFAALEKDGWKGQAQNNNDLFVNGDVVANAEGGDA